MGFETFHVPNTKENPIIRVNKEDLFFKNLTPMTMTALRCACVAQTAKPNILLFPREIVNIY